MDSSIKATQSNNNLPPRNSKRSRDSTNRRKSLLRNPRAVLVASAIGTVLISGSAGFLIGNSTATSSFKEYRASDISYENQGFPEGWEDNQSETDKSTAVSKRNPFPASSDKCTYKRLTTFLPKEDTGRGSEFLSQRLAYDYALEHGSSNPDMSFTNIYLDDRKVKAIQGSWDNRRIAVRVFDSGESVKVPGDLKEAPPQGLATVEDEGVPAVLIDYSCSDDVSDDVWKNLLSSTRISSGLVDK